MAKKERDWGRWRDEKAPKTLGRASGVVTEGQRYISAFRSPPWADRAMFPGPSLAVPAYKVPPSPRSSPLPCVVGRACLDTAVQLEFVMTIPRSFLPLITNPAPTIDQRWKLSGASRQALPHQESFAHLHLAHTAVAPPTCTILHSKSMNHSQGASAFGPVTRELSDEPPRRPSLMPAVPHAYQSTSRAYRLLIQSPPTYEGIRPSVSAAKGVNRLSGRWVQSLNPAQQPHASYDAIDAKP